MINLEVELEQRARALGFSAVGICGPDPARRLPAYMQWLEDGHHGEMGYLARLDRVARRQEPQIILADLRSIITVALDYATLAVPPEIARDPGRGRISNYAWGFDYHAIMTPKLEELAAWLRALDPDVQTRVYVDTGAILERDHAETAGLGFTGKNTMIIAPRAGSWRFLGELLTTLPLTPTRAARPMPGCGSCRRCLDACPTDAFPTPYVLDARRCISYLTIELKGWIPRELRPVMGNWLYGCDICQEVCPFNRFAAPAAETAFRPATLDTVAPPLIDILQLDEAAFNERFAHSPIKRIKRGRLLRNACVAAGNWGDQSLVPSLAALLHDEEAIVRGHAAWALHRVGNRQAERALREALALEEDKQVREELQGR